MADTSTDPKKILQSAKRILLVDWPDTSVPRTLLNAGFTVFGYSPGHYSQAEIVTENPQDVDQKNIFPPGGKEKGYLVFRQLSFPPDVVDIVNIYRPENEHAAIITNQVLPFGAKVLWLQPPVSSAKTRSLATEHGLIFIEGDDIAEIAGLI
jgi:predicted CoA-binding protein